MRRSLGLVVLLMVTLAVSSCSVLATGAESPPPADAASRPASETPTASSGIAVALLGPDGPVAQDQGEIPLVLRVTNAGQPVADTTVTFEVASGPASFPDGFEAAQTDATGVATALSLVGTGAGTVTIRASTGEFVGNVVVEIR